MPIRFISRTTSRPKSVRPPTAGRSVAASAHGRFWLWVSVRYMTPSRRSIRSTASELSIDWPPSAPISEAIRPPAKADRTSAARRAATNVSG